MTHSFSSEPIHKAPDIPNLRKSIYLDFFFIPCYAALLVFLCAGSRRFAVYLIYAAVVAVVAAIPRASASQ